MARLSTNKRLDTYSDSEAERQLMHNLVSAVQSRDIEGILSAYAPGAVVFDARDSLQYGKEGLKKSWRECFDSSDSFNIEINNPKITVDDNVAFSHCLSHATGKTTDGQDIDVWMRATDCYKRIDGQWYVIHEHVSVPGDFESGKILANLKP
jgi:uncharacterized protein (TIGR02246 family)